jgi:NAD(P)-dependent dehydrogenase (short-subunit alcohol dehydrogenase family)
MSDTTIWIVGANYGIGAGLVRHAPYPGARIVNFSNEAHPDYETILFDLTRPETWAAVTDHLRRELASFAGRRALFLHVGHINTDMGMVGMVDPDLYRSGILANAVAPLVFADAFIRACRPGYESGVLLMSSAAAVNGNEALATYGAAKAGIEQFVRVVDIERKRRGVPSWIASMRPGLVATPSAWASTKMSEGLYPRAGALKRALESAAYDVDTAAKMIWALLPPKDEVVLDIGKLPAKG